MKLSVVIPAFNEETRLPDTITRVAGYFRSQNTDFEILVVNDGSTDSTKNIVQQYFEAYKEVRLLNIDTNRGKGCAVKTGVLAAAGDMILVTDADLSTPIEDFENLERSLDEQHDVAIGSRRIRGSIIKRRQPLARDIAGKVFYGIVERFFLRGIKDTQCGFKLFKRTIARQAFSVLHVDGFCFDVELLLVLRTMKADIAQVAVTWSNSDSRSRLCIRKELFRTLIDLFRIRLRYGRHGIR